MEHAIGTKITLEVVENKEGSCEGCYFHQFYRCPAEVRCLASTRNDVKNIIYKEIKEN